MKGLGPCLSQVFLDFPALPANIARADKGKEIARADKGKEDVEGQWPKRSSLSSQGLF